MNIEEYIKYIKECRERGFDDATIKKSLLDKGWPESEISKAFYYADEEERREVVKKHEGAYPNQSFGSSITIFLDEELRNALEKRAKKSMFTIPEQIEDILRRSTLNLKAKKGVANEKLDDKLVGIFSRKNVGQKKRKKKAKMEKRLKRKQERKKK